MTLLPLFRAILVGFSIAAPVGPIGVLCIRRSLTEGWLSGLLTGLGAATADAVYGSVAGFGLTLVSSALVSHAFWLRLLGGLFLCYLGIKTLITKPAETAAVAKKSKSLMATYLSAVLLTLTNPATIMSFVAIFAGLGLVSKAASTTADYASAATLVTGVFLGSALWWFALSSSVSLLRSHFNPRRLTWLNRISGAILLVFGIISLSSVIS